MEALLTEWDRNTTNHSLCICPASGYKTPPAVKNIWNMMLILESIVIQFMLIRCELLLKKLSIKSGTGRHKGGAGNANDSISVRWFESPSSLSPLSSVASFHPTKSFSTFCMVGLSSFLRIVSGCAVLIKAKWCVVVLSTIYSQTSS